MYDIKELPDGTFPRKFTTIKHYQRKNPGTQDKLLSKNNNNSFHEGRNCITLEWFQPQMEKIN